MIKHHLQKFLTRVAPLKLRTKGKINSMKFKSNFSGALLQANTSIEEVLNTDKYSDSVRERSNSSPAYQRRYFISFVCVW